MADPTPATTPEPWGSIDGRVLYETREFGNEFGVLRIEEWPEGLVLWVGGEIRWRSWKDATFVATRLPERKREADRLRADLKGFQS